MKYIDIHTHKLSVKSNIISIVDVSLDFFEQTSFADSQLYSLGIHPWFVQMYTEESIRLLEKQCKKSCVKMIGECGLDHTIPTDFEVQRYYFMEQIQISEKLQKPLIVHCVGYYNELFALKKEINPTQKWIIHGFRGKPQLAEQALNKGFELSYGEKFNTESVRITPINRLYIESDNSEKSVEEIYHSIAEIKQCTVNDLTSGLYRFDFLH